MIGRKFKVIAAGVLILIVSCSFLIFKNSETPQQYKGVVKRTIREMTLEELKEDSTLICYGTVIGISDPFKIESVTGETSVFTDYYVQIKEVFKGTTSVLDTVTVRVQGGEVEDLILEVEHSEAIELDSSYLLFLYQPGMGGGYNTEGDYCYVTGAQQGVYEATETDEDLQISKITSLVEELKKGKKELEVYSIDEFVDKDEYSIEITDFKSEMEDFNKSNSVDDNQIKNTYLENLKQNLAEGFITDEEYEQSLKEIEQYATIIN